MTENIQKRFINHATVAAYLGVIVEKMKKDSFSPDLVVGLSRGGLTPGVMLSHFLGKPFVPFQTALRDHPAWNTDTEEFKTIEKVVIIDDIVTQVIHLKNSNQNWIRNFLVLILDLLVYTIIDLAIFQLIGMAHSLTKKNMINGLCTHGKIGGKEMLLKAVL